MESSNKMNRAVKIAELGGKATVKKEETETLRGKVVILNPDESEVAKSLGIKEKGVYGIKFR